MTMGTVLGQAKRQSRALSVASLGESVPSGRALFVIFFALSSDSSGWDMNGEAFYGRLLGGLLFVFNNLLLLLVSIR